MVPVLDYGSAAAAGGEREHALLADPREARGHRPLAFSGPRPPRPGCATCRLPMASDLLALKAESERLRAEATPLLRIHQVERQIRQLPRTVDEARLRYKKPTARRRCCGRARWPGCRRRRSRSRATPPTDRSMSA